MTTALLKLLRSNTNPKVSFINDHKYKAVQTCTEFIHKCVYKYVPVFCLNLLIHIWSSTCYYGYLLNVKKAYKPKTNRI